MKKWMLVALVVMLLAVMAGGAVLAGAPGPRIGGQVAANNAGMKLMAVQKDLKLTEQQIADIKKIHEDAQPKLEELQKAVRLARLNLAVAVEEGAAADKLKPLMDKLQQANQALADYHQALREKVLKVLTVEQQAKVMLAGGPARLLQMSAAGTHMRMRSKAGLRLNRP